MIRTFVNLKHVNVGFDPTNVIELTLDPSKAGYSDSEVTVFARTVLQQTTELRVVRSCAYAAAGVMRGIGLKTILTPVGTSSSPDVDANTSVNFVSSGYFKTMSIPFLVGRNFADYEVDTKPTPIVVNRAFADMFYPYENAVGKMLVAGKDGTRTANVVIVGIVGSSKYRSLREEDPPTYYDPLNYGMLQMPLLMYVRGIGDPNNVIRAIPDAVRQFAGPVPIVRVASLEQQIHNSLWRERLMASLFLFFAITALLIANLGVYGFFAYSVRRRARELALRIALGGSPRQIFMAVCGRFPGYLGCGILAGGAIARATVRAARHFVFGVDVFDMASFLAASFVVILSASFIAALAGRKAWNTDPAGILREE
jgi:hypothetical protein